MGFGDVIFWYTFGKDKRLINYRVLKAAYPAKVLLAWTEAVGGHKGLREWLIENGFKELGIFVYALHNKDDARKWLMENGHQHLLATIVGAEGKKDAIDWLERYDFDLLARVARSADGDEKSFHWLQQNGHRELAMLSKRMEAVKDEIERDNNDMHKISQN